VNEGSRKPVLVIGGGIAGLTAAVELADAGCPVILVEKSPSLGGQVAGLHQYFPKLCPPSCGIEMHLRRIRDNEAITVHTNAEVTEVCGARGNYDVTVRLGPDYVSDACTACGDCVPACPAERPDPFNYGLSKTKAVYLPGGVPYPVRYSIDRAVCPPECGACERVCRYGAVNLRAAEDWRTYHVSAVIAATGWEPYDAGRIEYLGFGRCANVVTNVMVERMAAADGPTGGVIRRPSDGRPPRSVAFVQCAGSRDENHLPYCSSVCCTASIKQISYLRTQQSETAVTVFYIDLRTPGRLEEFRSRVLPGANVHLVKGKVARVEEDPASGNVAVTAEDVLSGRKETSEFELVVLATGMAPRTEGLPAVFEADEYGFLTSGDGDGLLSAGCAHRPGEVSSSVRNATAAALKAYQAARRSERHV
jgi:quinone-modifying oxidoreductase subunit QmoA